MEYTPTLKSNYKKKIVPALVKEFNYSSVMQAPKLEKIILNQGVCASFLHLHILRVFHCNWLHYV